MEDNYIYLDDLNEQSVPSGASIVFAPQNGKPGYRVKKPDGTLGQWIEVDKSQLDSPGLKADLDRYIKAGGQVYKPEPAKPKPKPKPKPAEPEPQKPKPAEPKPAEPKPAEPEPKPAEPEPQKPKPAGQKLVWNKQRMDFDTPDGKPAPYPKVEPRDIDIRGLSAYRPGGALPRLSSTGVSASSSPTATTPTATTPAPAAPKPEGVSAGLKKWASIYGPGGPKELKQPTPSQRRLFKYTHPSTEKTMEAYDVVLDYLLSEGHAETVEEAHYVMMQLDSEYIQTVIQERAWWDPAGLFTKTAKEKALEKPVQGYNPNTGTTELGDPKSGYTDMILAPRGGIPGAMEKGKPETWRHLGTETARRQMPRYRAVRGATQLTQDAKDNEAVSASMAQLEKDKAEARARAQKLADEDAARETQSAPPIVAKPKPAAPVAAKPAPVVAAKPAAPVPKPEPKLTKLQQDILDLRQMRANSLNRQGNIDAAQKLQTEVDVARADKKMPPKVK